MAAECIVNPYSGVRCKPLQRFPDTHIKLTLGPTSPCSPLPPLGPTTRCVWPSLPGGPRGPSTPSCPGSPYIVSCYYNTVNTSQGLG